MFSLFGIPQESQLVRECLITTVTVKVEENKVLVPCDQYALLAGILLTQATPDPLLVLEWNIISDKQTWLLYRDVTCL